MEEIKPLVTEKHEFEYRDESNLLALFGIYGLSGFWCKEQSQKFSKQLVCHKLKALGWDLDGSNQAIS